MPGSEEEAMKRLIISAVLGVLMILTFVVPAGAAIRWCRADPIVLLNGVEYQLFVSIPEDNVKQVNGPILFEMYSPRDTKRELTFVDSGFNGYGERVEFRDHDASFIHRLYVKLPRTGSDFPMLVDVYRDGTLIASVDGTSAGLAIDAPIVDGALDGEAHLPVVLGGAGYDVVVRASDAYLSQVNGDVSFEIASPKGVKQARPTIEPSFNGYGSKVAFKQHSKKDHAIVIQVSRSGGDFPIDVEVFKDGKRVASKRGMTNGMTISVP